MAYIEPREQKPQPRPEQDIFYFGIVVKGTLETIQQIKQYILNETDATLKFQHKDIRYLKIEVADPAEFMQKRNPRNIDTNILNP